MSGQTDILYKDLTLVCRGCLETTREMKNMIEFGLAEDFQKLTNIKINKTDGLSKLICTECENVILRCRIFQEQCSQSDFILNVVSKKQSLDSANDTKSFDDASQNTITYLMHDKKLVIKVMAPDPDVKITYQCPQSCSERFKKKTDLLQHLVRRHELSDFAIDVEYYCSFTNCQYHVDATSGKHFTGRKYLNQHTSKVHGEKVTCKSCSLNFSCGNEFDRHLKTCSVTHKCKVCEREFKTNERLLVHLLRKHPTLHRKYKMERKNCKRKFQDVDCKVKEQENVLEYVCDSPTRSFATQTLQLDENIRNDVTLPSWQQEGRGRDEISTQTVFEDLLSLKSQTSEDESIFYSETVSLSDIQTQTLPLEFGLSRSNKQTITSETQSPDLSIKETQTCFCLYDSLKSNFKCGDLMATGSFCTTETQTLALETDLLSFSSAETQTCFEDSSKDF
ncbi:uncharacterized protein LOC124542216 [Vanessa cardui]|uniref:uncharacterized protein LOC124542216 n=1 Tax=Vanessa cardui TaxID=171605 RepID=UPI001F13A763|nr:uncharacterized protein LOC124542216 [Vanessa cardui]